MIWLVIKYVICYNFTKSYLKKLTILKNETILTIFKINWSIYNVQKYFFIKNLHEINMLEDVEI
jgi:hypothetical protein